MSTRRTRSRLPASHSFQGQTGIQRFTRSTKPGAASSLLLDGKNDSPVTKKTLPVSATTPCLLTASPSKKRKLNEEEEEEQEEDEKEPATQEKQSSVEDTPSKTIKFSSLSVSTPTRSNSRNIARTTSRKRRSVHFDSSFTIPEQQPTPKPSQPLQEEKGEEDEEEEEETFPAALDQLVNLHSAFLKTLGLHFTHKGPTAPADLKELLPSTEKLWRKRKVVVKDIQRIVHVWDSDETKQLRFRIANYGLGKVCLERVSGAGAGPVNENALHTRFVKLLGDKWKQNVSKNEDDGSAFVEALALAPIHDCLTPFTALRKGQQRLQDLKGGVIKVKTAMMKATTMTENDSKTRDPTADRRKGLLERIKSKELLQAKLGPPPTKEQMLRRSAAQRAEDVARVLALLRPPRVMNNGSAAVQKKPFKWEALIQTVQDSLRNPIPADEVAACLDILGQKEVAADWIDIVTINKLKSVVLMSGYDVSPREIGIKVSKMKF